MNRNCTKETMPLSQRGPQTLAAGCAAFLCLAVSLLPVRGAARHEASGSAPQQTPSGKEVVAPEVYVSLDPAGRGSTAKIAVVMKIRNGFHVNAREKSAEYLIATDLKAQPPAGFTLGEVHYPQGQLENFTFSKTPLNVYQGSVTLRVPVTITAAAPLGEQHIPLKLRYQACSTEVCLPPTTLPLDAALHVAASASNSKPAHREIFSAQK
jgi:DsbC/DsbD-like thiol-disulfide interchange protein